eukprot:TRINITY_DN12579_c0_g1_i5.p1 TRINITY_DN12579_c0_g1~~TRINITY_DN12579_c0_g1_i5.p1  ORF type:complete len:429 (-),score=42.39 TRINITY_DN12579_c0_g1_i5:43-1239(-)
MVSFRLQPGRVCCWGVLLAVCAVRAADMQGPHAGVFPVATLNNGLKLPMVGLGCASGVGKPHVASALKAGYRHFDTAQAYVWGYKEDEVGDALQESGVAREELLLQSKIHPEDLGYESTKKAVLVSLKRLRVDTLDSMLIHKPRCWPGACSREPEGTWQDSWRALEELYDAGKVRAIGICDVDDVLLDQLIQQRIKPHIIQNWMDPFHQDGHIRDRCIKEGIQYQGYSTLGSQWIHFRGHRENPVIGHPVLQRIAEAHNAQVAQVVLNWATRRGVAVVPASRDAERQRSNLDSFGFDLTTEEMSAVDALDGTLEESRPKHVSIVFENPGPHTLKSYWVGDAPHGEVLTGEIPSGGSISMTSYDGHRFIFKHGDTLVGSHQISTRSGMQQRHAIEWTEL